MEIFLNEHKFFFISYQEESCTIIKRQPGTIMGNRRLFIRTGLPIKFSKLQAYMQVYIMIVILYQSYIALA
jgi:hypothetical protein